MAASGFGELVIHTVASSQNNRDMVHNVLVSPVAVTSDTGAYQFVSGVSILDAATRGRDCPRFDRHV